MRHRSAAHVVLVAFAATLMLPAAARAHAYLVNTVPSASGIVPRSPPRVALTFSEAVEPRFAIVSVTDDTGRQLTSGPPVRSATDVDTLLVPLKHVSEGWYLVYWRVVSVDGHPVRGAFTFQVGPNPGPAPQFPVPSISESAATPKLVAARALVFAAVLSAIGLFVLRIATARPLARRLEGAATPALRPIAIAFGVAAGAALVAIPAYLLLATASFALRPATAVGDLLPLIRASAFGRGFLDLEVCFALFVLAAGIALWVDRPERRERSVAELLATSGALAAAAAVLLVPGAAGHAAQTAPRGLSVALDWIHLAAGSIWLGGLIGLVVLSLSLGAARRKAGLGDRRAALLERRARLGGAAARLRDLGDRRAHAHGLGALADRLRQDRHPQGRAARRGDRARGREPAAGTAATGE